MTAADSLPFSLEWLADAAERPKDVLAACPSGHLLITGRSCWAPLKFSPDLRALICEPVDHPDTEPPPQAEADEDFARVLHQWLDAHPGWNRRLREAAERWLVAKRL